MAVAAHILPAAPVHLELPDHIKGAVEAAWSEWWLPLRETLRAAPPRHGSEEERRALARFVRGIAGISAEVVNALEPFLRQSFTAALEELWKREDAEAADERRLGLRLLQRPIELLGELFEACKGVLSLDLLSGMTKSLPTGDDQLGRLLDERTVAVLRLELSVFVAFDLATLDPVEPFAAWARDAHLAAQRAQPFIARMAADIAERGASQVAAELRLLAQLPLDASIPARVVVSRDAGRTAAPACRGTGGAEQGDARPLR